MFHETLYRVFVTGTDTGVGKTFVSVAMAKAAHANGKRVFAHKPIETGCATQRGQLVAADGELLAEAAGNWQRGAERCQQRFALPASPESAAKHANEVAPTVAECVPLIRSHESCDVSIVEGAGGILVPLNAHESMADFAKALGYPVLVVARATLGTINHSLLTAHEVTRAGLVLAGIYLSLRPDDNVEFAEENRAAIARRLTCPVELFR